MLPDRTEETRTWFSKAALDARTAELLHSGGAAFVEPTLFHCQRAAEKALKAYLVWHDRPSGRTHSIVGLLAICTTVEPAFATLRHAATVLTPYAVSLRYPSEVPLPTPEQSAEALGLAQEVLSFVLERLPPEVGP